MLFHDVTFVFGAGWLFINRQPKISQHVSDWLVVGTYRVVLSIMLILPAKASSCVELLNRGRYLSYLYQHHGSLFPKQDERDP